MKKSILIADDDKAFLDAMALRCENLGPRVHTASDGAQVLMQVSQNPPDLLILDINMPSGNGLDVAARLLQDPMIPPVPVIFCSGRSDQESFAYDSGASDVLTKPVNALTLAKKTRALLSL